MGTSVPIFALPPAPCLRGPLLRSSAKFPARKIRVTAAIPPGPLGPGFAKIAAGAVPHQRLAWPSKRPGAYSGGSPKGLPYPIQKEFLENRRGGVCPSRGPASVRPLRKRREGFCDRRRGRPPEPSPSRGKVARPKVVTDEGDFLACTPPGGSLKGLPCRESERCAQGAMSSTARLPRAVLGLVPSKEKTP